jgi:hypothetical protein
MMLAWFALLLLGWAAAGVVVGLVLGVVLRDQQREQ